MNIAAYGKVAVGSKQYRSTSKSGKGRHALTLRRPFPKKQRDGQLARYGGSAEVELLQIYTLVLLAGGVLLRIWGHDSE